MVLPPLPPSWPYAPRPALPPLIQQAHRTVPGLPGVWHVAANVEIPLEGACAGVAGAFGRGGVFRVNDKVLRPYRRGGLLGKVVKRLYLSPRRFAQEYDMHRCLWEAGFPTVRPVGYGWRFCWPLGVEGFYITQFAEGAAGWAVDWTGGTSALAELWGHVGALCAWGFWSPDLNATNVLARLDGSLLLIDWDRACWDSSPELACRYKERLVRSLQKRSAPSRIIQALENL